MSLCTSYDAWIADESPSDRGEMPTPDAPDDDVCRICVGDGCIERYVDVDRVRLEPCVCREGDFDDSDNGNGLEPFDYASDR